MPDKLPDNVLLQAFDEADVSGVDDLAEKLSGDRFESRKLSGEGGAKEIYQVKDLVTGRQLALAYPRGESKDDYELILREARLHSLLEHPNIVRLYDIGLDEGKPFFTMKFVEGFTLEKFISQKPEGRDLNTVQINEFLDIFLKICDAISYAHSKNISHLDLKPSNIFLDDHGEVLVGDWGLARIANEPDKTFVLPLEQDYGQTTLYGYINGTPGYMAPEQCMKGTEKGPLSDIYSLGAVLVFMFCHRPPVNGDDEDEKIVATVKGDLMFDSGNMPESIQHIVLKALETKPEERYPNVQSMIKDIQNYRSGFMTSAEPSSFVKQLRLFFRRNLLVSSLILFFILTLTVFTMIYIKNIKDSERVTRAALTDLQHSQKENEELNRKRATEAYQKSLDLYMDKQQGRFSYDSYKNELALSSVDLALSLNPDLKKGWLLKGKLCLLLSKWEEAGMAFKEAGNEVYINLSEKINSLESVSADQVLLLLNASKDEDLTNHFIFKWTYIKKEVSNYAEFCKTALMILNKGMEDLNFNYNPAEFTLDISGNKNLRNLYPIRNMRIYEIDISGCRSITTFNYLSELPLKILTASNSSLDGKAFRSFENHVINKLDISHCEIKRLNPVLNMPLKSLNITGVPFDAVHILKRAGKGMEIICSPKAYDFLKEVNKSSKMNWKLRISQEL